MKGKYEIKPVEKAKAMVCEGSNLRVRTKLFASAVIRLFVALPRRRPEVDVLGRQLLRAGTSVAANYREASRARSDAEFVSKIEICCQEADETSLWLELLRDDCAVSDARVDFLLREVNELLAIMTAIILKVKRHPK